MEEIRQRFSFQTGPRFKEQTQPATPSAGFVEVYAKSDGKMYFKDDTGAEIAMYQVAPSYPLLPPNGSVTAPSYSFNNDQDAGMFLDSVGDLRLTIGGAAKVTMTDDGTNGSTQLNSRGTGQVILAYGGNAKLRLDGTDAELLVPITLTEAAAPATPAANKVVAYAKADGKLYRKDDTGIEMELGSTIVPHTTVAEAVGAGGTSTSATPVNLPVRCSIAGFVKSYAATKLIIHLGNGCGNSDPLGGFAMHVNVGGTVYLLASYFSTTVTSGQDVQITGLAAGSYNIELQWQRTNATGTLVQFAPNRTTLTVTETF
jgi:hypothetical protein